MSRDSIYRVPETAEGIARYFGAFGGCQILGEPCVISVREARNQAVEDMFGLATVRPGAHAIHISGLDCYGRKSSGAVVRAVGVMRVLWDREGGHKPSGTGCKTEDPVCITSSPGEGWEHLAHWTDSRYFITLESLWELTAKELWTVFSAEMILGYLASVSGRDYFGHQHAAALRRFLDSMVGVSNNGITSDDGKIGVVRLKRVGRWKYQFVRAECNE